MSDFSGPAVVPRRRTQSSGADHGYQGFVFFYALIQQKLIIRSALGYYLDVNGACTTNGTNIQVWTGKNNAQKYRFEAKNTFSHPMREYHTRYTQWGIKPSYRNGSALQYHVGVDYMSDTDSQIYAFANGKVVGEGNNNANGKFVLIEHNIPDQNGKSKTVYSFYAHLASTNVNTNDIVTVGTVIGEVGATGSSSGGTTHLHFSVFDYKWTSGGAYGYVEWFSGNKVTYKNVTYYNPYYIINNGKLP